MNKSTQAVMFSSSSGERETPQGLFDQLNREFHFNLDPCATAENAKCKKYFTIDDDGLNTRWGGRTAFVNPPYGREVAKWVKKSIEDSHGAGATTGATTGASAAASGGATTSTGGATVVMLLAARTDTRWFHDLIAPHASEVRFIRGRLIFAGMKHRAPFPSMIVVFRPITDGPYTWGTWSTRMVEL